MVLAALILSVGRSIPHQFVPPKNEINITFECCKVIVDALEINHEVQQCNKDTKRHSELMHDIFANGKHFSSSTAVYTKIVFVFSLVVMGIVCDIFFFVFLRLRYESSL